MDQILTDAKREDQLATVKAWYDGYHFGEFDIYCPWDVMNYVSRLQTDPSARPAGKIPAIMRSSALLSI